jgi:hypothetical protein
MTTAELLETARRVEVRTNHLVKRASMWPSPQARLQFCRIARAVKNRDYRKCSVQVDGVFLKTPQADSLGAASNFLAKSWMPECAFEGGFDFPFELFSKPGPLRFIPSDGFLEFRQGCRFESDRETHFQPKRLLRFASTCSQGMQSWGFFSKSARRRSSSADCSGVSSKSPYFSKTFSASACCSSGDNSSICSRICAALMAAIYPAESLAQDEVSCVNRES